jgi:hypothetical protein
VDAVLECGLVNHELFSVAHTTLRELKGEAKTSAAPLQLEYRTVGHSAIVQYMSQVLPIREGQPEREREKKKLFSVKKPSDLS